MHDVIVLRTNAVIASEVAVHDGRIERLLGTRAPEHESFSYGALEEYPRAGFVIDEIINSFHVILCEEGAGKFGFVAVIYFIRVSRGVGLPRGRQGLKGWLGHIGLLGRVWKASAKGYKIYGSFTQGAVCWQIYDFLKPYGFG